MKSAYWLCIAGMFLFLGYGGASLFCQQLERPPLVRVTVDPETGYDIIYWQPSPSPGVDYYVIGKVVRPNPSEPYALVKVDTVVSTATSFENQHTTSGEESIGYTVWAVDQRTADSSYYSLYDEPDSTIFTRAVFDSCQATIELTWNDYNTWRGEIQNYTVYQRLDDGLYVILKTLQEGTNHYTLFNVQENVTYSLFVEAEAMHEGNMLRSTSNRIDLFTNMSLIPDGINADYATLSDYNSIDLSFTVDPNSELQTYKLLRSVTPGGTFDTISTLHTANKVIVYHDEIPFTSGIHYYKLMAFNNCGKAVATSNLASNVLLGGNCDNLLISLNWNEYLNWTGGVDYYLLSRETGVQSVLMDSISVGTDTFFRDDFSTRIDYNQPQSTRVCYRITALESTGAQGSQNTSRSNRLCFNLNPDVRLPNAFIPNSNDGINNTFYPIFSFVPERYEIIIFNRSGLKIWEGSGPWDGKVNGNPASEGVYLYHLNIFNFTNTTREITGQVTVVYH